MSILSNLRNHKRQLTDISNLFESFCDADEITNALLDNSELQSLERELKKQIPDLESKVHRTKNETKSVKIVIEKIEIQLSLLFDKFKYLTEDLLNKNDESLDDDSDKCIKEIYRKMVIIETDLNHLKVAIAANLKGEV